MTLRRFHPSVRDWFSANFDGPTPPQRGGWEAIASGDHTLIAAPTGSGKTLAAFLNALDQLTREGIETGSLDDRTRVLYVSPLKALSADVHQNLIEPRRGIREKARERDLDPPVITSAVRSGDTPQSERRAMLDQPPHILVTTPESLYLLLTARKSREMLRGVRTVIVDEIHSVLESRRGSHLSISLERLDHVTENPLQRIGLSATQKPIREVARFLVGGSRSNDADGDPGCRIVDEGHYRELDLGIETPDSPLEAVLSGESRGQISDRIGELVRRHDTTLVFVNTRREAERVAGDLEERLGVDQITAHHGSLSKQTRQDAEQRLRAGSLRALVATASLELGIDIGHVDLVCQLGCPNRISTLLQRVGRSGHTVEGTPKGRLFPLTRDDLVQGAALLWAAREGELDRTIIPEQPVDILSQQIVAEVAAEDWDEEGLLEMIRGAYPYRNLSRDRFDEVVRMLARGFTTRNGRRGARIHHDAVNGTLKARKGSRLTALTSGGAIPDNADYRVLKEPEGTFVGTVNEDFAIESLPGDVFQLGNTSWRLLKVETGVVRVEDAKGEPPNIPFWLGEAPARSEELSEAVSELRKQVGKRLGAVSSREDDELDREAAHRWLTEEPGLSAPAADQLTQYLAESKRILGRLPTRDTLVLERFFDESGGMQLILHAPFGNRVNKAWGLALRKQFCRQFDFELQAAATEEGVLLSLGPQHSFPLDDVFNYLNPNTLRRTLVQALLDAPMFRTRWRWNASLSLALLRWKGGSKVPPQIQRMEAEDLLSAVFPDATACLEHVAGNREVPDHPLVDQTIEDCLTETMDLPGLMDRIRQLRDGTLETVSRETPEPSPLSHEILNASPYAFLDDAPLEERRARAVQTRRSVDPSDARALGELDDEAVRKVCREAWPEPETPDELHDALLRCGFLTRREIRRGNADGGWTGMAQQLAEQKRATRVEPEGLGATGDGGLPGENGGDPSTNPGGFWVAAERLPEARLVWDPSTIRPRITPPEGHASRPDNREEALREMVRGRLDISGPITTGELSRLLEVEPRHVETALRDLEGEGSVLRGRFRPGGPDTGAGRTSPGEEPGVESSDPPEESAEKQHEWCDRRLLARIHRGTLDRLRSRIQPVSAADFTRFLFRWQRVESNHRARGREGLASVIEQLEGFEAPAAAWEVDLLAPRCAEYDPEDLDRLCSAGRVAWGRLSSPSGNGEGLRSTGPLRSSPMTLWLRGADESWIEPHRNQPPQVELSPEARKTAEVLDRRGASFFHDLVSETGLLPTRLEGALGELAGIGLVTSDGFSGLRALLTPSDRRPSIGDGDTGGRKSRGDTGPYGIDTAGRWFLIGPLPGSEAGESSGDQGGPPRGFGEVAPHVEAFAHVLLRRYGVVFRKLLENEEHAPPWRELSGVYRRLEARGEIRGGRFVNRFSGGQFALPEAVGSLREVREEDNNPHMFCVSGADPLNLTGVISPGERIPSVVSNRIGYVGGVPVWGLVGGEVRQLNELPGQNGKIPLNEGDRKTHLLEPDDLSSRGGDDPDRVPWQVKKRLQRRNVPPVLRAYAGAR